MVLQESGSDQAVRPVLSMLVLEAEKLSPSGDLPFLSTGLEPGSTVCPRPGSENGAPWSAPEEPQTSALLLPSMVTHSLARSLTLLLLSELQVSQASLLSRTQAPKLLRRVSLCRSVERE